MKRRYFARFASAAILVSTLATGVFAADENVPETVKTTDGRVLKLTWNDEFNGEGLPDPSKWSYEVGYVRNDEAQYYTDARLDNIFQKDGLLTIRTLKEDYDIKDKPNNKGREKAEYTSAAIETLGKASWQYGRVEVRAKLPSGVGIWPAIWMMGDNITKVGWPTCGEIDIMEYVGHTPRTSHATIHMHRKGAERWKNVSRGHALKFEKEGEAPEERFCVYALEWTKDYLKLFVDDALALDFQRSEEASKTEKWPFDQKCFMILNTAIGGTWGAKSRPRRAPPSSRSTTCASTNDRAFSIQSPTNRTTSSTRRRFFTPPFIPPTGIPMNSNLNPMKIIEIQERSDALLRMKLRG